MKTRSSTLVLIADGDGPGWLHHEDRRAALRRRLALGSARHREDVTSLQHDRAVAQGDRQLAVQHQEELVGVVMGVPDVLAAHLGHPDVVVVDPGHDARAPQVVEGGQGRGQGDRFVGHPFIVGLAGGSREC